jgi:hypothetical protein
MATAMEWQPSISLQIMRSMVARIWFLNYFTTFLSMFLNNSNSTTSEAVEKQMHAYTQCLRDELRPYAAKSAPGRPYVASSVSLRLHTVLYSSLRPYTVIQLMYKSCVLHKFILHQNCTSPRSIESRISMYEIFFAFALLFTEHSIDNVHFDLSKIWR